MDCVGLAVLRVSALALGASRSIFSTPSRRPECRL
jgi:hypothetical protein